jgi:cell division protein FtsW
MISSGGSSLMMTCAAMGLLLRISYELDRARRQRGERSEMNRSDDSRVVAVSNLRPNAAQQVAGLSRVRNESKVGVPS